MVSWPGMPKGLEGAPPRDPFGLSPVLLRFAPATRARFERETGAGRCRHLRRSILVGLAFYNAYDLSDLLLVPDVARSSTVVRLLVLTPLALVIAWCVPRLEALPREALVTAAMVAVIAIPAWVLARSTSPMAGYTFAEIPMTLMFGAMMLVLDVTCTAAFVLAATGFTTAAILRQPVYAGPLSIAMLLQMVTSCAFVLYGNRQIERVRRTAFLTALRERQRAEQLEEIRRHLTTLSGTDALTGLANRRALEEALLAHEAARETVALVMMDIDFFKPFNDTYGHLAGDTCIAAVAGALSSAARPQDLVARFGGEEFVLVATGTDEAALGLLVERLRAGVRDLAVRHDARPDGRTSLTLSAGSAVLALQPGASRVLIDLADGALYEAKRAGRDLHRAAAPLLLRHAA